MRHSLPLPAWPRPALVFGALLLLCAAGFAVWAQISGERGIAAVAATNDIQVGGIEVDIHGDTGEEARQEGWVEAQRKAWEKIKGPKLSDSQLTSMVSAIVIERERMGPKRYIATLGVVFDRTRASRYLGSEGQATRSAPMLLVPVTFTAGSQLVYEQRNPWQSAWAQYQPGTSRINYVRPSGAGGDSILVTYGQTGRRSRTWWRNVLDQFGAADVLVAIANLEYSYPGGPVEGRFTARYGPDNNYLGSFTMKAADPEQIPAMMTRAVTRLNGIFEAALADGTLRPDPTLNIGTPDLSPAVAQLIAQGRAEQARQRAEAAQRDNPAPTTTTSEPAATPTPTATQAPAAATSYTVQFASPDGAAVDAAIAGVRGAAGVRSAATSSLAIGGTSVMRVSYAGSLEDLAGALRARGFTVRQAAGGLSISR
ncbi:heavy-metal-associated domain-containing protein [Qipengyuania marisflavi]|uniref:Heavy-metal-associated domain-containing protein n=1 Tax=Qipengyuania marisflavi TaxID=2486356 RepID=A0A5S3PFK5_9SPHN|nr:heavy-metal-associated domain-containing protein [Qipengyuania marisflavi]